MVDAPQRNRRIDVRFFGMGAVLVMTGLDLTGHLSAVAAESLLNMPAAWRPVSAESSVVRSISWREEPPTILPVQAPVPQTSMQLFRIGSAWYIQNKFAQAIPPYQQAMDMERTRPQMDKVLWRVLVDNLGMAYGMTGHLPEAKATFEQGIKADPTYPMFHYNLACTYAEMNDLDHAMSSLKTAYANRRYANPGEEAMPDPRQDSSFQRFMNNDAFRRLVTSLTAGKD